MLQRATRIESTISRKGAKAQGQMPIEENGYFVFFAALLLCAFAWTFQKAHIRKRRLSFSSSWFISPLSVS